MVANLYFANATRTTSLKPLAIFLLAPFGFSSVSFASQYAQPQLLSSEWHQYIAQELASAAGVEANLAAAPQASMADAIKAAFQRDLQVALKLGSSSALTLNMNESAAGEVGNSLVRRSQGFSSSQALSPTISKRFGQTELYAGAVFVYESFSSDARGVRSVNQNRQTSFQQARSNIENSSGSAALIGVSHSFERGDFGQLSLSAAFQSKMNMDAYQSYRGLSTQPGRFDVPAKVSGELGFAFSPRQNLSIGIDRVDYSSVQPFTSRLLPDRFVSLLGDGASPVLSWEDLTVYRAAYQAQLGAQSSIQLSVSSSLQPTPTSERLRRGLEPLLGERAVSLSYAKQFGKSSKLRLGASYMPFTYVFGPSLVDPERYSEGAKIEGEASFEVSF